MRAPGYRSSGGPVHVPKSLPLGAPRRPASTASTPLMRLPFKPQARSPTASLRPAMSPMAAAPGLRTSALFGARTPHPPIKSASAARARSPVSAGGLSVPVPPLHVTTTRRPLRPAPPTPVMTSSMTRVEAAGGDDVGIRVIPPQVKVTEATRSAVELIRAIEFALDHTISHTVTRRCIAMARVMLEANANDVQTLQAAILLGSMKDRDVDERVKLLEEVEEQFGYTVKDIVCQYAEGTEEDGPDSDKVDLIHMGKTLLEMRERLQSEAEVNGGSQTARRSAH